MNFNVLTTTLTNFITAFSAAWGNILPIVNWLIGCLLAIEIILIGLWWALGGGDKLVNVFKKILYIGFWMWIVTNFPSLCHAFVNSLIQAGNIAGGGGANSLLDPSRIAGFGLDATVPLATRLGNIGFDVVDAVIIGISYILIMISFLIIAWQVFYAVLEYYLMVAICGVLIPFGFLKPTRFLAEKAISAIVSSGVKLMILSFILSVAEPVLSGLRFTNTNITFNELFAMLLTAGAIAYLAWNAPSVAAGLLAGAPSLSAGSAVQNAVAGAMLTGMAAQAAVSSTRSAATGIGSGFEKIGAGKRAAENAAFVGVDAYQSSRQGGAGIAASASSGFKAAKDSMVSSATSEVSQSEAAASSTGPVSGGGQSPGWAVAAMHHLDGGKSPSGSGGFKF